MAAGGVPWVMDYDSRKASGVTRGEVPRSTDSLQYCRPLMAWPRPCGGYSCRRRPRSAVSLGSGKPSRTSTSSYSST